MGFNSFCCGPKASYVAVRWDSKWHSIHFVVDQKHPMWAVKWDSIHFVVDQKHPMWAPFLSFSYWLWSNTQKVKCEKYKRKVKYEVI